MNVLEFLKGNILCLDGGMGTLLQKQGLMPGEYPERWNITHKDIIRKIHKDYYDAGSNVVSTNTFGANILKFSEEELDEIVKNAFENAIFAKENSSSKKEKFVALDIGPTGKMLKPYGELDFEDAVSIFAKTVKLGVKYGADLILIETMNDSLETKAAVLAAKENSNLPVFVSNAYGDDERLMTGATPEVMCVMLEGLGVDAIGANCSFGPKQLEGVIKRLLKISSKPVILKPNAGLPKSVDNKTVYDINENEFAAEIEKLVNEGVGIVGGCCGTTPDYIKSVCEKLEGVKPSFITEKNITAVSSYSKVVTFGESPILIGERINPTGKKLLKEALKNNDIDYILKEGIGQQEKGAHILDVNVGTPDVDEEKMLEKVVLELQTVTDLPLQIDTSNPAAMEKVLRKYNGKAMINSVNGKIESMECIFPLVKKYGGVVVALTLDENGIPEKAEDRVEIAKKILKCAKEYGIDKKDIIFDTLAMTVSADKNAAINTIKALDIIKNKLKCHTSLGVSNVSFGLPKRDAVNSTFFALALGKGLSCAIMNPYSKDMMKVYYAFNVLKGFDENCSDYIDFMQEDFKTEVDKKSEELTLKESIIKGLKEQSGDLCGKMLKENSPLDIVKNEIVPALDVVGVNYENGKVYLPQLLMSAESAKSAFEKIKEAMLKTDDKKTVKCDFVIATVKGDIHDIGKNIVKLILENYGFNVVDLGKDVPPEVIVDEVIKIKAPLVGLSALMTTTVPSMEETIKQLRSEAPWCKIVVGGAVLTEEYARSIGADKYARDAMETVRYAEKIGG